MQGDNHGDKTIIADDIEFTVYADQDRREKKRIASLIQYSGVRVGRCYKIDLNEAQYVAGRSPDADIRIDEQSVSRKHVQFKNSDSGTLVVDLGSANGTFVNDKRITSPTTINDGNILRLGTVLLKFFSHNNLDGIIQDKIYRMATIDSGTQIFNKKYLLDTLASEFTQHRNRGQPLSLIYFDLDHFKRTNDNFGHNNGDVVLRDTAKIVSSVIRKDDTFGRFGGEEFVIILPNTTIATCREMAERIRRAIATHVYNLNLNDRTVEHRQTVSLGIQQLDSTVVTAESFLEKADQNLYASKSSGRNRVTG
ncbi:MAG: GGDEF domain-containing protein [Pseudomonadota bacterium]|nr:GGDEF domain-containing protein [Pseudomonadota bacterium]